MAARKKSDEFGILQAFVDDLYSTDPEIEYSRLEILLSAESFGLNDDLQELINLLPPSRFGRDKLCSQLNSSLSSHGWGYVYGAVH